VEDPKILQKTFDMIAFAYSVLAQFPKSEKYALAADIKRCMDKLLELEIEAHKRYHKKTTLQNLDIELAKLRAYTRLAHELGFLLIKKYERWSAMNVEIGKMIGGWIKSQAAKS
jgi:four helix bundle protein